MSDASGGVTDSGGPDAGDDASDGSGDAALVSCPGTGAPCEQCCDTAYPVGAQKFDALTLACGCAADLCGPLDGGTDDGGSPDAGSPDGGTVDAGATDAGSVDAGAEDASAPIFGVGACTDTCNGKAAPSAACNACFRATLGSVTSPGICGTSILTNCVTDPQCEPYFLCVTKCN